MAKSAACVVFVGECVVLRMYGAGRDELPNQQNQTQMQFIVGVNVRPHTVEGTKSPTVCNFLFLLRIHFKVLLSGPSRVTGSIQRLFSSLRSFVGTQNHSDAASRTADTAGSNWGNSSGFHCVSKLWSFGIRLRLRL